MDLRSPVMTYDFHGSWNDKTGVNAPLYDQEGSPEFSVHGCVVNWMEGEKSTKFFLCMLLMIIIYMLTASLTRSYFKLYQNPNRRCDKGKNCKR